jgi:hypothetical protein
MVFLPAAAPIPPLTLFRGQQRVASLGYCGLKSIETADVDALARYAAKFFVHFTGIPARELADGADSQQLEIAKHGGPNRNQILQTAAWGVTHKNLLDKDIRFRYL